MVVAHTMSSQPCLKVLEREALSLLLAIKWSLSLGLQRVIVEMDCKQVVDRIMTPTVDVSEFGYSVNQCKLCLLIILLFLLVLLELRRQANMTAHNLAKVAMLSNVPSSYHYVPPPCIADIIYHEMI